MIHGDSDVFRLFKSARRSAQYVRMRSEIAWRFFGVSRCRYSSALPGGRSLRRLPRSGLPHLLGRRGHSGVVDGFLAAVRAVVGIDGAISMPNISDRSSLASRFVPADRLPFVENSAPAVAIKSC